MGVEVVVVVGVGVLVSTVGAKIGSESVSHSTCKLGVTIVFQVIVSRSSNNPGSSPVIISISPVRSSRSQVNSSSSTIGVSTSSLPRMLLYLFCILSMSDSAQLGLIPRYT
ncbi:hypothetical protein KKG31_05155 [Patescibacteria group bacterium]|nr:hypothetical protein [Patescibacteria group bacterium]